MSTMDSEKITQHYEDVIQKHLKDYNIAMGNTILGYFEKAETFDKIINDIKEVGYSFCVRDSDDKQSKRRNKNDDSISCPIDRTAIFLRRKMISYFGCPFSIEKSTKYECTFGNKYYKSKCGQGKMKTSNGGKVIYRNVMSKKIGCQATMTLKKICLYPEYNCDSTKWRRKKALIDTLKANLVTNPHDVEKCIRYCLTLSIQSCHNHPSTHQVKALYLSEKQAESQRKKIRKERTSETNDQTDGYFPTVISKLENVQEIAVVDMVSVEPPVEYVIETVQLQDVQTMVREKLERIYLLCQSSENAALLLRLSETLDEIDKELVNDIGENEITVQMSNQEPLEEEAEI